ncbi:MAG TPA: hypothetical protein VFV99_23600 [Kofleriaceae bacterium]|nr:hypothetical protein [Kofleriaceae bacterium]
MYGALLGLGNTAVIALGIAVREHGGAPAFMALLFIGSFVGVPSGMVIGAIAKRTPGWPVFARLVVIIAPAFFVVTLFGTVARFDAYIVLSFVPTIVAALYLERWTRATQPLPAAQRITNLHQRETESNAVANARW